MRLGIFGGSFNPPHRGHRVAAEAFCEKLELDHLLVIPAGLPPHKTLDRRCSDLQRLEMTRLNFSDLSTPCTISDMEMKRKGKSYTVDTLLEIQAARAEDDLFLYCGSDMLLSFSSWYQYERILQLCTLCVMKRREESADWERALGRFNQKALYSVRVIDSPHVEESSTHLRDQLAKGESPTGLLPAVADYIRKKGLYV